MEKSTFKPAWWLLNPHLQTIWPTLFRKPILDLPLTHERFELLDGDFLDLNWLIQGQKPIVIILHGFEGSINSPYAKGMMRALWEKNLNCVFMHFRGCSGIPNRLQRCYHSGDTADLAAVVQEVKRRYPGVPIAALGFSLGGNVLLKWLGETGKDNPLSSAVAISVPFELQKCSRRIQRGLSRLYQAHFLKCLRSRLSHKYSIYPPQMTLPISKKFKTLEEFDDQFTAPLHGFISGEEYYRLASCRRFLAGIQIPTLILHSRDDPFSCPTAIPKPHEIATSVKLELTDFGGHVGFIMGDIPGRAEYWLEKRAPLFLKDQLDR